jgi:hypothetical protein
MTSCKHFLVISGEDEEIEAEEDEETQNEDGRDEGVVVESYNGVIMLEDEGEESEDHDDDDDEDDEGKSFHFWVFLCSVFHFP